MSIQHKPSIIAAGDILYPEIVFQGVYQTNLIVPANYGEGTKHISVTLYFWERATKHMSVLLQN